MCCNSHMVLHVSSKCIVRQGGGLGRDSPPLGLDAREARLAGEHVDPRQWNALLQDPDVLVIDTRNEDEICVGSFRNAVDPKTQPRTSCGEARWLATPLSQLFQAFRREACRPLQVVGADLPPLWCPP